MASAIHGLALPEISVDNFEQSWTRFEFVAVANKWDNGRELAILPALLRGKLQDFYITLGDSEKKDLPTLKKSLRDRAGLTKDPLTSAKKFTEKKQDSKESVRDFEVELRKLFAEAYPDDEADRSSVLLGRFVTGLLPDITKQILLRGVPTKMEDALLKLSEPLVSRLRRKHSRYKHCVWRRQQDFVVKEMQTSSYKRSWTKYCSVWKPWSDVST